MCPLRPIWGGGCWVVGWWSQWLQIKRGQAFITEQPPNLILRLFSRMFQPLSFVWRSLLSQLSLMIFSCQLHLSQDRPDTTLHPPHHQNVAWLFKRSLDTVTFIQWHLYNKTWRQGLWYDTSFSREWGQSNFVEVFVPFKRRLSGFSLVLPGQIYIVPKSPYVVIVLHTGIIFIQPDQPSSVCRDAAGWMVLY